MIAIVLIGVMADRQAITFRTLAIAAFAVALMAVPGSKYPTAWLDWDHGDIYTKNPDEPILAKMLLIASALGAKVQGDDGEFYRSANFDDTYYGEGGHP